MAPKRPFVDLPWDHASDQPAVIGDRNVRRLLRRHAWRDALVTALTAGLAAPGIAWRCAFPARMPSPPSWSGFLGCGVSPRPDLGAAVPELVEELGVRRLLVRVPWRARDRRSRAEVCALIAALAPREVLAVFPQDRAAVCEPRRWGAEVVRIAAELPGNVAAVQLGNAVNRLKWGCASVAEYLDLCEAACEGVRATGRAVVGSAVIDFEPHVTARSLVNARRLRLDACAALLYVDRRGSPRARQYGVFDLAAKIRVLAAILACSPRCANRLWLTEVNWPLAGTGAHAPTGPVERVDEDAAAAYLGDYCRIARDTRLVERVYPWQLVAPGYGLVDDREGLRRRPAFHVLADLLRGGGG